MSASAKSDDYEVSAGDLGRYYRQKGFKSVRIHFGMEVQHPESLARFTCKKHFGSHGTFWLKVQDVIDAEEKGLSACPCCAALQEEEVVDFATFQKDVKEQRRVSKELEKATNRYAIKRGTYGLPKYAVTK